MRSEDGARNTFRASENPTEKQSLINLKGGDNSRSGVGFESQEVLGVSPTGVRKKKCRVKMLWVKEFIISI